MVDLKSIWELHKPSQEHIIIKTKIDDIPQFKCYAATNHLVGNHLYLMELAKHTVIPEFKNSSFKGVQIEVFQYEDSQELNIYLIDSELKDIFSLFIENIIEDIKDCSTENEAVLITSNIIQKWKRLFDKINFNGLSLEQQKGLLGELLFFDELLNNNLELEYVLSCWTGPDFEDKDFNLNDLGVEVKFSTAKTSKIKITSERQLDVTNFKNLYLSVYQAEVVKENGISLNSIIEILRDKISKNSSALKFFNERLMLVGYFEEDIEFYNTRYGLRTWFNYEVAPDFPKLTIVNLPKGFYNASYYIEQSAIENYVVPFDAIINNL